MTHIATSRGMVTLHREGPHGSVSALVNPVGAGLEALLVGSLELIERFPPGAPRPFYAGVSLAPWPNRIADGVWNWEGETLQLEINEPARQTALHGLVSDRTFDVSAQTLDSAELGCTITPEPGYPFTLRVSVSYQLTDSGITVTMSTTNLGRQAAPVALGAHPFLCVGDVPTRSLTVTAPIDREVLVDDRLLPVGVQPREPDTPEGTVFRLSEVELDTAYGLRGTGPWRTLLASEEGVEVVMWQDASMGWLQLFLTDSFPGVEGTRSAVAVEPMTAPPNAFQTGEDVTTLQPGQSWSVSWGVETTRPHPQ